MKIMSFFALALWAGTAPLAALAQSESSEMAAADPSVISRWEADRSTIFDAADVTLEDLNWTARAVIVFADSPNDPQFQRQMDLIASGAEDLAIRDVMVIADTDPAARSALRLHLRPRGFMLVLVGKDGETKLRKPAPWSVRELSRSIDKTPLRQQEIEERRGANG